jgi:Flp pilus assembly protein TadB
MTDFAILIIWGVFAFVWLPLWGVHFFCVVYVLMLDVYRDFQRQRREDAALIRIVQILKEEDAARLQIIEDLAKIAEQALTPR